MAIVVEDDEDCDRVGKRATVERLLITRSEVDRRKGITRLAGCAARRPTWTDCESLCNDEQRILGEDDATRAIDDDHLNIVLVVVVVVVADELDKIILYISIGDDK